MNNVNLKLFCFPYAGGASNIFNLWNRYLNTSIDLLPIELAGRGKRVNEPHYFSIEHAIDDVFKAIASEIKYGPYALFGHSMGAMLAYELARKVKLARLPEPEHLFISGRYSPCSNRRKKKNYHQLDDDTFKSKVKDLGGTPPNFFKYPELMELFLPLLRNDFKLAASSFSDREIIPLDCNISVFLGKNEDMLPEEVVNWKNHTKGRCTIYYFNGGHFFLNNEQEDVVNRINEILKITS